MTLPMPDFLAEALTWPKNYNYAIAIETAINLHLPPSMMIIEKKQLSDGWSKVDKKLAMAWTVLQKETCKECGQPLWICRSSDKNLYFSVQKGLCYAKAEIDKWQDKSSNKLRDGEYPYVVPKTHGDKMPTRKQYYDELMEE